MKIFANKSFQLFCTSLFGMMHYGQAQQLNVSDILQSVYQQSKLKVDTVFYIGDDKTAGLSIQESAVPTMKIVRLAKKDDLIPYLQGSKPCYLLKVELQDKDADSCTLLIDIAETDKIMYGVDNHYYTSFYDARVVQCKYDASARQWIYDKTVTVYGLPLKKTKKES